MTESALISTGAVRERLAVACRAAGSQRAFAAQHGLSRAYLSAVLCGDREPGPAVLAALRLERVTGYRAAT